jgi:hypothetical protein
VRSAPRALGLVLLISIDATQITNAVQQSRIRIIVLAD